MNPIIGPFTKSQSKPEPTNPSLARSVKFSRWYRQRRPYNLPLEYDTSSIDSGVYLVLNGNPIANGSGNQSYGSEWRPFLQTDSFGGDPHLPWFAERIDFSLQKSLTRFNDKRGEAASLGVALAQTAQSISMIEKRLVQGWNVVNAIRKGRINDVLEHMFGRGKHNDTWRRTVKDLSSLQLEISFGWLPTIADVQSGIEVLNGPFPYGLARGAHSLRDTLRILDSSVDATHKVTFRTFVSASLEVENPGLDLAQRLGLTDPLPIINELVPWSFVANWIFNLEEFIGQYNGYHGVRVINPYYGIKVSDDFSVIRPHWSGNPQYAYIGAGVANSFRRRVGSLPTINLGLRPSIGMPWQRALNAISLIIQKGIKGR